MIVSRVAELARLDDMRAALIRGEGSALVVHGDPGIGKTTLLEALVERCGDAVTVVRACGAETEAELAFSALADLLDPVLSQLDTLPVPQAAALMGALALEPPAPGDRRTVQDDHALTPQELRVAAAVRRGASNRDVAADLFLSPKTVEFHLRQIYRKLGVHSRTQLVAALAAREGGA
jgi:DNA-binding NarL/FixJ family response regulator